MKYLPLLWIVIASFFSLSCTKKDHAKYSNINVQPIVMISHDESGNLIGFIALNDLSNIKSVLIHPSGENESVYITALGKNLHETISSQNGSVYSNIDVEGFTGSVRAQFKDEIMIQLLGNGIQMPSPITSGTLTKVDEMIESGTFLFPKNLPIEIN